MLNVLERGEKANLTVCADPIAALKQSRAVWVDLLRPTAEEEAAVEAALRLDAPTSVERSALEDSARFWDEPDELGVTATLLSHNGEHKFDRGSVAFILKSGTLVTVREIEPKAFKLGSGRASLRIEAQPDGAGVLTALLEGVSERLSDVVDNITLESDLISQQVFGRSFSSRRLVAAVARLGRLGTLAARVRESLTSLERLAAFLEAARPKHGLDIARIKVLRRDLTTLVSCVDGCNATLLFLLDAALGMAGAQQNRAIQAVSIVAVIFLPPTLIASVFGMNFVNMPELQWVYGYPMALGLMALSAAMLVLIARVLKWW